MSMFWDHYICSCLKMWRVLILARGYILKTTWMFKSKKLSFHISVRFGTFRITATNLRVDFSARDLNAFLTMQTQRTSAVFSTALISVLKLSSDQTSEWSSCFCKVLGHDQLFLSPYHNSTCTCLFTSLSGWKISFPLQDKHESSITYWWQIWYDWVFCVIINSTYIIFFSTNLYPD